MNLLLTGCLNKATPKFSCSIGTIFPASFLTFFQKILNTQLYLMTFLLLFAYRSDVWSRSSITRHGSSQLIKNILFQAAAWRWSSMLTSTTILDHAGDEVRQFTFFKFMYFLIVCTWYLRLGVTNDSLERG